VLREIDAHRALSQGSSPDDRATPDLFGAVPKPISRAHCYGCSTSNLGQSVRWRPVAGVRRWLCR
jgi:hypothetical protein